MGESSARKQARLRAELILKVRAGLMTATEAAGHLGVSRKTYYTRTKRKEIL
jgi:DNA invertase Pin-like site-specific DNA recombinase